MAWFQMCLGNVEYNLLYVLVELLRHLPAGVTLLALRRIFGLQIGIDQTGNATPGEALLHLLTLKIENSSLNKIHF